MAHMRLKVEKAVDEAHGKHWRIGCYSSPGRGKGGFRLIQTFGPYDTMEEASTALAAMLKREPEAPGGAQDMEHDDTH